MVKRWSLEQDAASRKARSERRQWRVTLVGLMLVGAFLLFSSLWGVVATWRVAAAFRDGGTNVNWRDGPDLVVMAAPLLVAALRRAWPGRMDRPFRSMLVSALLAVLIGTALGKGDAVLLDRVASLHGYHYCETLDVWDPHGSRGGGPALQSWGYSRAACPASGPATRSPE